MRKIFYSLLILVSNNSFSQWSADPLVNNPICEATGNQMNLQAVSNGSNGAVIVWQDLRNGNNDIYVQQINAAGAIQWANDGIAVCTAAGSQSNPQIINAGNDNYMITWQDNRYGNNDIYMQLVNSSGVVQWTGDGIPVCIAAGSQIVPKLAVDGSGGVIVVWQDARNTGTTDIDIYAQRINASGTSLWTADGIAVCSSTGNQNAPQLISDNSGGAILTWTDSRGASTDIYAQRIDADGADVWTTANGVLICGDSENQYTAQLTGDESGGAIIAWNDERNGNVDIYAQYINAAGVIQWLPVDGVGISAAANNQFNPQLLSDGAGGAFIVWEDGRSGNDVDVDGLDDTDIYAQKIATTGVVEWPANGIAISAATGDQITPKIIADGSGGAIIVWSDARVGAANDIYAQRVNNAGDVQWTADGSVVSSADGNQFAPQLVNSGDGAIVTWYDGRILSDNNIYASHLNALGTLPVTALTLYGKHTADGNILNWTTATEQHNQGFDIEKSADGRVFTRIGFVAGSGNSTTQQSYSFTDKNPAGAKNYYRLKQVDLDGRSAYSAIILLQANSAANSIQLYPNPAKDKVYITMQGSRNEKVQWQLIDDKGRILQSGIWQTQTGTSALPVIDISRFAPGIYFIRLNSASIQKLTKVLKQ